MKLLGEPTAATSATSGAMGMRVMMAKAMRAPAMARRRSLTPLTSSWMYVSVAGGGWVGGVGWGGVVVGWGVGMQG